MADNELGRRLLQARLDLAARRGRPVSLAEIGRALGVTGVSVGRWEAGTKEPDIATLVRLAALYGVAPGWLTYGDAANVVGELQQPSPPAVRDAKLAALRKQAAENKKPHDGGPAVVGRRRRGAG